MRKPSSVSRNSIPPSNMNRLVHAGLLAVATAVGVGAPLATYAQAPATAASAASTNAAPAVVAHIRVDEKGNQAKDVEFVNREGDKLFYRQQGGPREASTTLNLATLVEVTFDLHFDEEALAKARIDRNWSSVAALLYPSVTPLLSYLDLKDNNAVDVALELGTDMMKAATAARAKGAETNKVTRLYTEARRILGAVSGATWFEGAEVARLRAIQCLVAMGELKQATRELRDARAPDVGDNAYGLYWFVEASLRLAKGNARSAMDAIIKSLVFENKDIETFPDALLFSGRCYEDLLEFHRARDVYYEVARLFPQTEWDTVARQKLQSIMDRGMTKTKEVSAIENVFFAIDEDMDVKSIALLKGEDEKATAAPSEESIEDAKDDEPVAKKKTGEEGDTEAPPPAAPPPAAPPPAAAPVKTTPPATTHTPSTPHKPAKTGTQH